MQAIAEIKHITLISTDSEQQIHHRCRFIIRKIPYRFHYHQHSVQTANDCTDPRRPSIVLLDSNDISGFI